MKNGILIFSLVFAIFGSGAAWYVATRETSSAALAEKTQAAAPATLVDQLAKEDISVQSSPDGSSRIVMRVTEQPTGMRVYTFTTTDGNGENPMTIYEASSSSQRYFVPFNAWSPDNKYVFIQKGSGDALVFTKDGEPILPDTKYLDVKEIFEQNGRNDQYRMVTGWASETLLIIQTIAQDGAKGNSYWFEVPSKAIIQLWGDF